MNFPAAHPWVLEGAFHDCNYFPKSSFNCNASHIPSRMLQVNFDARPIRTKRKSLRPLDDHNRFLPQSILESQRFEVMKIFDTIKIHVINLAMVLKHVDEGEGGTGDFLFLCGSQPADDAFGQRGLPAAQVSGQQDKDGWVQLRCDFPALRNRFLGGMRVISK